MTEKSAMEWAKAALQVQDACNLSGVVHSLAQLVTNLHSQGHGTTWVNQHPLVQLFVDKLGHLANVQGDINMRTAYIWCQDTSEGKRANDFEYSA